MLGSTIMSTSPYENQEELTPIFVRLPGIICENAITAFKNGRRTAVDTLADLDGVGAFNPSPTNGEPSLLPGTLLSIAYGIDHLELREAAQSAPPEFARDFCEFIELCVECRYLTAAQGILFLALFGAGGAR
jgi:hypothetical protein